jgi:hypothetical protein
VLIQSRPTSKSGENGTVDDDYHLTTTKTSPPLHNLSATLGGDNADGTSALDFSPLNLTFPSCNTSMYTDDWHVVGLDLSFWWSVQGWKEFTVPNMTVQFDGSTANFSIVGFFQALPYVLTNATYPPGIQQELGPEIQGAITLRFSGVLDPYHSDILDGNSTSPKWIRTVGFHNNSRNIGYDSSSIQQLRRPSIVFTVCLTFVIIVFI